ncbi:MAG: hypothetical protein EBR30_27020 [Cytophagia bacterium]|nr:hypothetical protein [Cytophagia bacterium]
MIAIYVILCYLITILSMITNYVADSEGEITIADVVVFLTAPFSVVPILTVFVVSQFANLDHPLLKK